MSGPSAPLAWVPAFPSDCTPYLGVHTQGRVADDERCIRVFALEGGTTGFLVYGPYCSLAAGSYVAHFAARVLRPHRGPTRLITDVIVGGAGHGAKRPTAIAAYSPEWHLITHRFTLEAAAADVEVRLLLPEPHPGTVMARAVLGLRTLPSRSARSPSS